MTRPSVAGLKPRKPHWHTFVNATRFTQESNMNQELPRIALKLCEYDKGRRVLKLASEFFGMPSEFFIVSHHTGKEVRFVPVGEHDVLFDSDQWDGEQQIYRPVGNVPGVDHMVIYHQW
jgi:hypothetical protein